jgi:hypothetical protein
MFGQDPTANQQTAQRTTSADTSVAPQLSGEIAPHPALAQQTSTPADLADAPSATQQSSCTQKSGKPCPEWLHKLIRQYPPIDVSERWDGQPDHFFTFGNARRALHPDKKSWLLFTAAHAGMWASTIIAVRNHRTSHEEAHSEYPAVVFMTGIDLLVFKTISPSLSVGPPVYAMVHYSRAAAK